MLAYRIAWQKQVWILTEKSTHIEEFGTHETHEAHELYDITCEI